MVRAGEEVKGWKERLPVQSVRVDYATNLASATYLHLWTPSAQRILKRRLNRTVNIRLYPSPFVYSGGQYLGSSGSTCDRLS